MEDDWASDQVLSYPLDPVPCLVCGEPVIAWPEGLHHQDERLDADHAPVI